MPEPTTVWYAIEMQERRLRPEVWEGFEKFLRVAMLDQLPDHGDGWKLDGPMRYVVGYKWPSGERTTFPVLYCISEARKQDD